MSHGTVLHIVQKQWMSNPCSLRCMQAHHWKSRSHTWACWTWGTSSGFTDLGPCTIRRWGDRALATRVPVFWGDSELQLGQYGRCTCPQTPLTFGHSSAGIVCISRWFLLLLSSRVGLVLASGYHLFTTIHLRFAEIKLFTNGDCLHITWCVFVFP